MKGLGQELEQNGLILEARGRENFKKGRGDHQCQVLQRSSRMRIRKKPLSLAIRSLVSFERRFRYHGDVNDSSSQIMMD